MPSQTYRNAARIIAATCVSVTKRTSNIDKNTKLELLSRKLYDAGDYTRNLAKAVVLLQRHTTMTTNNPWSFDGSVARTI